MTARQLYEAVLIELNKENAPNILLEDFNYFANKAIYQYINKRYNIYDINQQTTDDIRVLKATAVLPVNRESAYDDLSTVSGKNAVYYATLPSDYLHLLNCICVYNVTKTYKCYNSGDSWRCAATRLTSDAYSQILDNFWTRPTYKRPYYYIHNINTFSTTDATADKSDTQTVQPSNADTATTETLKVSTGFTKQLIPTNPYDANSRLGTDFSSNSSNGTDVNNVAIANVSGGIPSSIKLHSDAYNETVGGNTVSLIEKSAGVRYGNASTARIEIRYGTDDSIFALKKIFIDYIKAPQHIRLTQAQIDQTEDSSQLLEYPDYVCQEIGNELIHILMENISEQRLQTHPLVSQSIANPAQQQTQPAAQAQ